MKKLLSNFVLAALLGLLPGLAMAGTLNPLGGNAWDLYVMGNGDAIFQILTATKLITTSSGFTTLLLVLATVGFFFLAIQAGFDPGKNLMKMFGFLLSVIMIVQTTHTLKANVTVNDPVTNYYNTVTDVPALVAVPTAIISEVGHWMTQNIETAFSVPGELSVAQGGGYNLATAMMQDAQSFVITNPELKKSLAAFAGDCVIPALARKQLSTADLKNSNNLWAAYANAGSPAIFTRYYYSGSAAGSQGATPAPPPASITCPGSPDPVVFDTGMGGTTTCSAAYACLTQDLNNHAQELLDAKSSQWAKTGTMIPWEQRMQVALDNVAGGQNQSAAGLSPVGSIMQSAMVNETSGMFRQAAVQSGDNEILLAASVSQAEAQQKSAWVTGSLIFQNMMGYVYTVLQAFTFGLIPIVLIALMIPGLGHQIFVSFGQLLVWMTLWEPMLAIINFLTMVFSRQTLGSTWMIGGGGVTMANRSLISEQTSNLVTVSQFLGTMVPLISWGLVKGSMAFTEFIAHGIGNSFASSAGAQAASGNLSMGNMSMNNVSSNKYDTSSKSTVGNQETNVFTNTGAGLNTAQLGGAAGTMNAGSVSNSKSSQQTLGHNAGRAQQLSSGSSASHGKDAREGVSAGTGTNDSQSSAASRADNEGASTGHVQSDGQSFRDGKSRAQSYDQSQGVQVSNSKGNSFGTSGGGDISASGGGSKPKDNATAQTAPGDVPPKEQNKGSSTKMGVSGAVKGASNLASQESLNNNLNHGDRTGTDTAYNQDYNKTNTRGNQKTTTFGNSRTHSAGTDQRGSTDQSAGTSVNHASQDTYGDSRSGGSSFQSNVSQATGLPQLFDIRDLSRYRASVELSSQEASALLTQTSASAFEAGQSAINATGAEVDAHRAATVAAQPSGTPVTANDGIFANKQSVLDNLQNEVPDVSGQISAGKSALTRANDHNKASYDMWSGSVQGNLTGFNGLVGWEIAHPTPSGPQLGVSTVDEAALGVQAAGFGGVFATQIFQHGLSRGGSPFSKFFDKKKAVKK